MTPGNVVVSVVYDDSIFGTAPRGTFFFDHEHKFVVLSAVIVTGMVQEASGFNVVLRPMLLWGT